MRNLSRLIPALAAAAVLALMSPDLARAGGQMVDANPGPIYLPPQAMPKPGGGGSDTASVGNAVYNSVIDASAFCAALPESAYQIDCLSERLDTIYKSIPDNGPYDETKAALKSAAARLKGVVEAHRDGDKPGKSFATASGDQRTTRRLRPVDPARQAAAVAQAVAIIEETQTVLLRSSANSAAAGPQIERIAAAVGSNKVLLRSA